MMRDIRWKLILRYALFQIPDLVLLGIALAAAMHWWDLPTAVACALFALWVAKDVAMFPFLRVAYDTESSMGADAIEGALAVVVRPLGPSGYVRLGSELWKAKLIAASEPLPEGASVRVVEIRGLTLLVEPMNS